MPTQIVLSWTVSTVNTPFSPLGATAALAAVSLYDNPTHDPVLGQLLGLTVATDVTTTDAAGATRTLTLNMFSTTAPPAFPCQPRTSTPPQPPYPLMRAELLEGNFAPVNGSMTVGTSSPQTATLSPGDTIQFLAQQGVYYIVASVASTTIDLTVPYTGVTQTTGAFREVPDPATILAVFSTSTLDAAGAAGARRVSVSYTDSAGNPFTVGADLNGTQPVLVTLDPGSVDVAQIDTFRVLTVGAFSASVGQITLVELKSTPTAAASTDERQMLIGRPLVYMPPSYFAIAQQGASQTTPATPPSNAQLSVPLAGAVSLTTEGAPVAFVSAMFAGTIRRMLAVPVTANAITFV